MSGGDALRDLATLHGVLTRHRDGFGTEVQPPAGTLVAVLRALGVPVDGPDDAPELLRAERERRAGPWAQPIAVAWEGEPASWRVRTDAERVEGTLRLEDGAQRDWRTHPEPPAPDDPDGLARVPLPHDVPRGRHRASLEADGHRFEAWVLKAPPRAPAPGDHAWGLFAPLPALPARSGLGAGDLGDLRRLIDQTRRLGGGAVATLPFLAAFLDAPYDPSPYAPASRHFWNEDRMELEAEPETDHPDVRALLRDPRTLRAGRRLSRGRVLDPRGVHAVRRTLLAAMVRAAAEEPSRRRDLEAWLEAHPDAADYARFRAACTRYGAGWPAWPRDARTPDGPGAGGDPEEEHRHAYAQWVMDRQLARLGAHARDHGVLLVLDLPLGVHADGFDTWRWPERFARGMSVGAPPDGFFHDGQDWGFPPPHPRAMEADGCAAFGDAVAHLARHAGALRIDHVMGLHRLLWVPHGARPAQGAYVQYPHEALYATLLLEAHRHGTLLVGEDLGTVPPGVREAMDRHGVLRSHVLQMEAEFNDPLPSPPPNAATWINTHDLPPFAAFWTGRDVAWRRRDGLLTRPEARRERRGRRRLRTRLAHELAGRRRLSPHDALSACLDAAGRGGSPLVLVSMADLWGETHPQNRPGTSADENWRRRVPHGADALDEEPARGLLATLDQARRKTP